MLFRLPADVFHGLVTLHQSREYMCDCRSWQHCAAILTVLRASVLHDSDNVDNTIQALTLRRLL
jgi:hypothetical protein